MSDNYDNYNKKPETLSDDNLSNAAGGINSRNPFSDLEYKDVWVHCTRCPRKFKMCLPKGWSYSGLPICKDCQAGKTYQQIYLKDNNKEK